MYLWREISSDIHNNSCDGTTWEGCRPWMQERVQRPPRHEAKECPSIPTIQVSDESLTVRWSAGLTIEGSWPSRATSDHADVPDFAILGLSARHGKCAQHARIRKRQLGNPVVYRRSTAGPQAVAIRRPGNEIEPFRKVDVRSAHRSGRRHCANSSADSIEVSSAGGMRAPGSTPSTAARS